MGPNFAQRIGLDVSDVSVFMAAVLSGALVLHWPLGWLSDRVPRHLVVAGASFGGAISGVALAGMTGEGLAVILAAGMLFGGFGIPIYSLCFAHANDHLMPTQMLSAARGLLLLNGLGTAVGPFAGSLAMMALGPGGLFLYAALLLTALALVALPYLQKVPFRRTASTRCPHTPQTTVSLTAMLQAGASGSAPTSDER